MPLVVREFEQRTRSVEVPAYVEHVRERVRRLPQQLDVAGGGCELVRPRGVCRSVGVAYCAPEEREHPERAHPERVIVEIVGQLERRSRVLERSVESLLEANRPREPALDDRLKRGTRDRLAQRLLEQRDGSVETFELGQEDESLGPQWADVRFGQQVGCDRPGTSPLPRAVMRMGRRQRPTTALVVRGRRCQPNRLLGELGRDGRCAARGRKGRGVVEHSGGGGVGRVAREREVTSADDRVVDDAGDPAGERSRRRSPRSW